MTDTDSASPAEGSDEGRQAASAAGDPTGSTPYGDGTPPAWRQPPLPEPAGPATWPGRGWGPAESGSTPPPPGVPSGAPWESTAPRPPYAQPSYSPGAGPEASGWTGYWHGHHGSTAPYGSTAAGGPPFAPGGAPYGSTAAGGVAPPYAPGGGWMAPPPPDAGAPWAPANRATRRRRRGSAVAAGVTAGLLAFAGAGVLVGHAAWRTGTSGSASASSPTGTGSGGTGSGGTGSGGTGSGGTGSGGIATPGTATPGTGLGDGTGSGSASGSASSAAGAPSDAAAIVKKVEGGLVDIDTTLGYQEEAAAGTGMVLTSNGEILTNNHVIDGATSIRVTDIGNGRTYGATVVGYDRTQDVAVLQLNNASGLRTVTLGNSSALTKGEAVVGIGNAGGAGGTPSYAAGSVTATNQAITASDEGGGNAEKLVGLIETDAAIEPGDSGGSLVTAAGQVIGMDTAASTGGDLQTSTATTSYAIPIAEATSLAAQIESGRTSSVVHIGTTALLGVEVEGAGQGTSIFGGTSSGTATSGAVIAEVVPSSPASAAGLAAGDTITGVNGRSVSSPSALTNALSSDKPGDAVHLSVEDGAGQHTTVTVKLAAGPPQ